MGVRSARVRNSKWWPQPRHSYSNKGMMYSFGVRAVAKIAGFAIAFRVFSALLTLFVNVLFPNYRPEQFTVTGTPSPFWDAFARYDSGWYWQIARYGYTGGAAAYVEGGRSSIGFFPAYPLLMRYVGRAFGRRSADLYLGGLVISWLAFALAMVAIYYLARLDVSRRRATWAALLCAVFPFAFFFGAVYSESLFLASTLWCVYLFRTRRWIVGGLCGALATATRVNGILMWLALAWIVWQQLGTPNVATRGDRWRAAAGLLLVPLGIGAYSLYIYDITGHPFEWVATIERWGYHPGGSPVSAVWSIGQALVFRPYAFLVGERMAPYDSLNGLAAVVAILALPWVWLRLGAAYGVFMAANLWLPLSSGQVEGMGRYVAVLFPLFIWLAKVCPRRWLIVVSIVFAMLYSLCLALFTNLHPLF